MVSDIQESFTNLQTSKLARISNVITGLGLAIAMVYVGFSYSGESPGYCTFGAVDYLYNAGIVSLVANGIGILSSLAEWCALRDGKISAGENCVLAILRFAAFIVVICDFVVVIWGSVVVFGNYSKWTYDVTDEGNDGYCHYTPMMFAFVLLIIKWTLVPVMFVCTCLCAFCFAISA